jgi:hypothetical protein
LLFKLNNCVIPTAAPYIHAPILKKTPATIIRIIKASNLSKKSAILTNLVAESNLFGIALDQPQIGLRLN